jgi:hypothetical protein
LFVLVFKIVIAAFFCVELCLVCFLRALAFFWCVSSQAAALLLTHIAFALLASAITGLSVGTAVAFVVAVVLVVFAVCIKGFGRLLRLVSVA